MAQLDEGAPNLSLNCWFGTARHSANLSSIAVQDTFLGGQARDMQAAHMRLASTEPGLDTLMASSAASAASAANADAFASPSSAAASTAADAADEALLDLSPARGLQTLLVVRYTTRDRSHHKPLGA